MTTMLQRLRLQARVRARRLRGNTGQRGQSVVELAIFMPLILVFSLACIQFAVLFIAYVNVLNVTRDAARWVAIHPHVVDGTQSDTSSSGTTIGLIKSRLPAGLTSSNLNLTFTPACASLTSGKCSGRDAGVQISATSTYTITSLLFLPSTFGWGSWQVAVPQTLPSYTIYMQVEPN
jgi:Flp pilus assembly protein TadG